MKKYIILAFVFMALAPIAHADGVYFSSDLSLGSSGGDVTMLQSFLLNNGFDIPAISTGASAKGYFGQQTKNAVMKYQVSVGVANTGYVGPLTRAKLNGNTSNVNLPPVIRGITAPTTLVQGQSGTWTIDAYDPEDGSLTYSVDWGDTVAAGGVSPLGTAIQSAILSNHATTATAVSFVPSKIFNHTYNINGQFIIRVTVRDSVGNQTQSITNVLVTSPNVQVLYPNGGEQLTINTVKTIRWDTTKSNNPNQKVDIYLDRQRSAQNDCVSEQTCQAPFEDHTFTLDTNILGSAAYNWIVGTDVVNHPIPAGSYTLEVCLAGTNVCDYSDKPFNLIN